MSKYKVGDKFIIEIEETICGYGNNPNDIGHITEPLHRIKGFNTLVFDAYGLDKLQKYDKYAENLERNQEVLNIFEEKYNQGLQDAWELARKICGNVKGCYQIEDIEDIFNTSGFCRVMDNNTYQEALAKIEAYEKSQQIQVGDVVYVPHEEENGIVVGHCTENSNYEIWLKDYDAVQELDKSSLKKTGRHIDINSIFEQIRGNKSGSKKIPGRVQED